MKRRTLRSCLGVLGAIVGFLLGDRCASEALAKSANAAGQTTDYYVAAAATTPGQARWQHHKQDKQDGPFATLERARDEIRKLKAAGPLAQAGECVRPGRNL